MAKANHKLYKSTTIAPSFVLSLDGELLDASKELEKLSCQISEISDWATYVARNEPELPHAVSQMDGIQASVVGRRLGLKLPEYINPRGTGASRRDMLMRHNAVTSIRSWNERVKAAQGDSQKHVSQGWVRTANKSAPTYGVPYVNLAAADKQFAYISNNPILDGEIHLHVVIDRQWRVLIFPFGTIRFADAARVCLPIVSIKDKKVSFSFPVEYDLPVTQFSSKYLIGVDVGRTNYVTLSVVNQNTGKIVFSSTLSQRVHSLYNSVRASEKQVKNLQRKAERNLYDRQKRRAFLEEAALHRAKNISKKRELAIIAAQEIAELSHLYDNAVVAVEDLSWIANTMQNGRWNRGELLKWVSHYVSQNGGWMVAVNSAYTSQLCHVCQEKGFFRGWHTFYCPKHGIYDRDVNAAANVALRAKGVITKARSTRSKNKNLSKQVPQRTPKTRGSLRHPGRDRSKSRPTPSRAPRRVLREVNLVQRPATSIMATVVADVLPSGEGGTVMSGANRTVIADFIRYDRE